MKKPFLTITLLIAGFAFAVTIANAQGLKGAEGVFKDIGDKAGANTYQNPEDVIGVGIGAAITLVGMIFLVLMVYAGYLWMTARGEQEQVDKAQKIITTALIGFFIVASAYAITKFVSGRLGGTSGGSSGGEGLPPPTDPIDTTTECVDYGGMCISDWYVGGGSGDYDKSQPCDPGGDDPFEIDNDIGIGACKDAAFDKDSKNACCKCAKPDCSL